MVLCDYFERVKEQTRESYSRALEEMSQYHKMVIKCQESYQHSYKNYCFEVFLDEKLKSKKKRSSDREASTQNKEKEFKEK